MKVRTLTAAVLASAVCAVTGAAHASLVITSSTQSSTITFAETVGWENPNTNTANDVYRHETTDFDGPGAGNRRWLLEQSPFSSNSSDIGLSSNAFSIGASGIALAGLATGQATLFGASFNGDADTTDNQGVISGATMVADATYGVPASATDFALSFGSNGAVGSSGYTRPYRSYAITLRVQNSSGAPISLWSSSVDAWWGDEDSASATMSLAWSTDLSTWTNLDSFVTSDAGTTTQLATERDMAGTFNASVPDGGYLYLRIANLRTGESAASDGGVMSGGSGSGAMLIIDNWNVSAVPEPTSAALLGLGGLALLVRRR